MAAFITAESDNHLCLRGGGGGGGEGGAGGLNGPLRGAWRLLGLGVDTPVWRKNPLLLA